jgi:hypothetical protein
MLEYKYCHIDCMFSPIICTLAHLRNVANWGSIKTTKQIYYCLKKLLVHSNLYIFFVFGLNLQ